MSIIKKNILANLGGNLWTGLMSLVFVPIYIHFMGVEAYGLVGIYATLLALFGLLDMGLSATLNRELARMSIQVDKNGDMRDLVRTLEIPYWIAGIFLSVFVVSLSPFIAYRWVNVENLPNKTVQDAVIIMGIVVAFQWPTSFYSGGLRGLQRQVLLNGINIGISTLRSLGAVIILWLVSPTVEAYFLWHIVVSAVNIGLIAFFLWRSLPNNDVNKPRFRIDLLSGIWRFAAGMTGITVLATILVQLDKIILSRMLSLTMFGYYTLASLVAMNLSRLVTPVFTAIYPRLTNLIEMGAMKDLIKLYHKSAQIVSVMVLPAAIIVALFSKEIMYLWTRNYETAKFTYLLVSILVMGTAFNGLMNVPYALQLASGWTRLTFLGNIVSVVVLVPLMIVFTKWYGAVGAASVWLILNCGYVCINIPIMHRKLLPFEKWRWYYNDVGKPLLAAVVISIIGRYIVRPDWSYFMLIFGIVVVSGGAFIASALAASQLGVVAKVRSFF